MTGTSPFDALEPAPLWRHFRTLCEIPRASGHEEALRDAIQTWANARGLESHQDATGNLLIRKPGTPGMTDRPCVALQGHLDMVCQANRGVAHDFLRDPIRPRLDGDWLVSPETTLGADNGIGVATALAVLEAEDLPHGPLEVLLTVDEESGMTGARGLQPGWLQAELLLNLDTEDWGEFYIGCAGGLDVDVSIELPSHPVPGTHGCYELRLLGLRGGHSGVDIHLGRGNAIRLMLRTLRTLHDEGGLELVSLEGGSARNAIPREAQAVLALDAEGATRVGAALAAIAANLRAELGAADPGLKFELVASEAGPGRALDAEACGKLLDLFLAAPCGVRRMSPALAGVVETSNNLGVFRLAQGRCTANLMVRSLVDSAAAELAREIQGLFRLAGARTELSGAYPGWKPVPDSPLLQLARTVFEQGFGHAPAVKVIHAGLECGLIGGAYPDLQMISFGPDIRGAHAPGERVDIASVGRAYALLAAILAALPPRP